MLILCSRTSGKGIRTELTSVDVDDSLATLKNVAKDAIDIPLNEAEFIYAGLPLRNDDKQLKNYGITTGAVVHVIRKPEPRMSVEQPDALEAQSPHHIVASLQAALLNPAYRGILERMLEDPDTMENIMAATPGLEEDPVAVSILQDPTMLGTLANPDNIKSIIAQHPALGQAALLIAAAVTEEGAKDRGTPTRTARSSRATYNLDDMSDDDDDEYNGGGAMAGPSGGGGAARRRNNQMITSSQLAQALAAASAAPTGGATGSSSSLGGDGTSTSAPSSSQDGQAITTDFFQEAISSVMSGMGGSNVPSTSFSSGAGAAQTPQANENLEAQLQQLKDMGITDENVARQALQASGGDLQTALAILFGDEMFP